MPSAPVWFETVRDSVSDSRRKRISSSSEPSKKPSNSSRMAARPSTRKKWQRERARARRSYTTAPRNASPKTGSNESAYKIEGSR